jgi:hypothetical protein
MFFKALFTKTSLGATQYAEQRLRGFFKKKKKKNEKIYCWLKQTVGALR